MNAPSRPGHWRILDTIRRRYRTWRAAREGKFELQCAGAAEVERIAKELGFSGFELRSLVSHPDESGLLGERLAGLHMDPSALARSEPAAFRDLQKICALCGVKQRCARDLAVEARDPAWQEWRDYCPNATTLSVIGALQICSEVRQGVGGNDASLNQQTGNETTVPQ